LEEGEKDGFSPIFISSLDGMRHFIRRKAKEWIFFNAHWARKTFTSLGSKWVGSKGEVRVGCVKEEAKEKS
jgi:hypothetical protein